MKKTHCISCLLSLFLSLNSIWAQERESYPQEVRLALSQAGANRKSFEEVLKAYADDSFKHQAACYLIANMPFHYVGGRVVSCDTRLDSLWRAADDSYWTLIQGSTAEQQESDPLHGLIEDTARSFSQRVATMRLSEPVLEVDEAPDIEALDGEFVRKQVDYACALREKDPRLQKITTKDFFDYVLSYRAIDDYPLVTSNAELGQTYAKYLQADTAQTSLHLSERYNRAAWWLRHHGGDYPFDSSIGFRENLFTGDFHDCVDKAFYAAQIYRACGWPAAVEFNVAYKLWNGKHFHLSIPQTICENWQSFSPETELPRDAENRFRECLNIYRFHFDRQQNSPGMLKRQGECVPEELSSLFIEDVSPHYVPTCALQMPVPSTVSEKHNLVYLASFQSRIGLVAATWGRIDPQKNVAVFDNVVEDNIYFPVYTDSIGTMIPFAAPFRLGHHASKEIVTPDSECLAQFVKKGESTSTNRVQKIAIARKFPRKPSTMKLAERTVGTYVIASDSANFAFADTLARINTIPSDEWTDLPLNTQRPYRFYRVCAPQSDPHLQLSEIQFLTKTAYGYPNTTQPTALDGGTTADSVWCRVLDEPLDKCKSKSEYDGNVQTAPDAWPDVTLRLKEAQRVECLRYVVKNADNHVKTGHWYALHQWTERGWENIWHGRTKTNHLPELELNVGGLYWLSDLSEGTEELPFLLKEDGTVEFPHEYLLNTQE